MATSVADSFLFSEQGQWLCDLREFGDAELRSSWTETRIFSFRDSLTSCLLLFEMSRRFGGHEDITAQCACHPNEQHARDSNEHDWRALRNRIERVVFVELLPVLIKSFHVPYDPLWDEVSASVMSFCAVAAQLPVHRSCFTSHSCLDLLSLVLVECDTTGNNKASVNGSTHSDGGFCVSPILQNVFLLFGIATDACRELMASSRLHTAVHQVFLQCCNTLSDGVLCALLLSAITDGIIVACHMYTTDLDVLLCILRRMQSSTPSIADTARRCECKLLHDIAPSDKSGVADVVQWVQRLNLHGDYAAVLKQQGVDGDVLWSDLQLDDVIEMGIHNHEDAVKLVSILASDEA
mmetsp:Transcript_58534/g.67606  ORF Transcript_58534/g.67606 Transcript_58534/m.67606 type:complete len:351 (+) Transcript_58534:1-1053(+)